MTQLHQDGATALRSMPVAFVYAIGRADACSPVMVKIGWSASPSRRLAELQRSWPDSLAILYQREVPLFDALKVERRAHALLAECRVAGEWFNASAGQAQVAIDAAAGALPEPKRDRSVSFKASDDLRARIDAYLGGRAGRTMQDLVDRALDELLGRMGY